MNATAPAPSREWQDALTDHGRALGEVVATADSLDEKVWEAPREEGSWSPAEIVEHLALAYEAILREIRGEGTVSVRVTGWRQRLFRWLVLPHILFHRSIPVRVRSPREARPGAGPFEKRATLERLQTLGDTFQREITAAMGRGEGHLTHPYFGRISPLRALRFVTVHLEHHHRQIRSVREGD